MNQRDEFERMATGIKPPGGVSKEPLDPNMVCVVQLCQEWAREYAERLVHCGILPRDAVGVLNEAKGGRLSRSDPRRTRR